MFWILIDTSSSVNVIALLEGEKVIALSTLPALSATEVLLPSLIDLLKTHQKKKEDICFIAIGVGPGSFTGTRIGVITAKALAVGLQLSLVPFNSLMLYAKEAEDRAIARDAKSGYFYLSIYKGGELGPASLVKKEDIPIDALYILDTTPLFLQTVISYCLSAKKCPPENITITYLKNP